jgi:LPXTG-motif cell wall-anchored protein
MIKRMTSVLASLIALSGLLMATVSASPYGCGTYTSGTYNNATCGTTSTGSTGGSALSGKKSKAAAGTTAAGTSSHTDTTSKNDNTVDSGYGSGNFSRYGDSTNGNSGSGKLKVGPVALPVTGGQAFGLIIGLALITSAIAWLFWYRRKRRQQEQPQAETHNTSSGNIVTG